MTGENRPINRRVIFCCIFFFFIISIEARDALITGEKEKKRYSVERESENKKEKRNRMNMGPKYGIAAGWRSGEAGGSKRERGGTGRGGALKRLHWYR